MEGGGEGGQGGGTGGMGGSHIIQVTAEEKAAIDRVYYLSSV